MGSNDRLAAHLASDPTPDVTDQIRDRVAARSQRLDARFPRAVDLEAEALQALHGGLRGVASALSGTHCPEHFREMLRGQRSMPLGTLCRLATDPTREARTSAVAAIAILARPLGRVLMPIREAAGTPAERAAEVLEKAVAIMADVAHALEDDGRVDSREARGLLPRVREAKTALVDCEAVLAARAGEGDRG